MINQSITILKKNFLLISRNYRQFLVEICLPLIVSAILVYSKMAGIDLGQLILLILPTLLPFSVIGLNKRLLVNFVAEKHERYKETQKIMGCTQLGYLGGWFLTLYCEAFFIAIITAGSIAYAQPDAPILQISIIYFGFVLSITHQTFFLTTFFNSPKLAGDIGSFIQVVSSVIYYIILSQNFGQYQLTAIFLLPQPAFTNSLMPFLKSFQIPFIGNNNQYQELSITMLWLDVIIYFILFLYFDQVLPNEYGVRKSPFFFLKFQSQDLDDKKNNANKKIIQDSSSAIYHQQQQKQNAQQTIQIENLTKTFQKSSDQSFNAVDNITYQLYQNQIFCLLGHNGSGKTTTINLLTGMIPKTEGILRYKGIEYHNNFDSIRQKIGLCGQKNVLYDDMTVIEHLLFYGRLKGKSDNQLEYEMQTIIPKTGLSQEKSKFSKDLSGGNKRKLSLAIALIGGSEILFLDEPTSGMDPVSRKGLWDILKQLRGEGKTIILTTHHLEEAEQLADRIGIMKDGKMFILGNQNFIKKQLGDGYTLQISKGSLTSQQFTGNLGRIENIVKKYIQNLKIVNKNEESFKSVIPFQNLNNKINISNLFKELETVQGITVNMDLNTLEEVFFNMEETTDKNMQKQTQAIGEKNLFNFTPKIKLFSQTISMAGRQIKLIRRNKESQIMILLPIVFCVLGVYITKKMYEFMIEWLQRLGMFGGSSEDEIEKSQMLQTTMGYFATVSGFFILIGYCFNSSVYVLTPIKEKESEVKYILNVMGAKFVSYWVGTFISDYICFLIPYLFFVIGVYAFQVVFLMPFIFKMSILVVFFGLSLITYSYVFSFVFDNSNKAFKQFPIINFFMNFLPWFGLNSFYGSQPYSSYCVQILYIFMSPFYLLKTGFSYVEDDSDRMTVKQSMGQYFIENNIENNKNNNIINQHLDENDPDTYIIFNNFWSYIILFIFQAFIYMLIVYYFDQKQKKIIQPDTILQSTAQMLEYTQKQQKLDSSVINETQRIQQFQNIDPIKAKNLHKVYENGFHALKGTNFGVKKNEIFALLGPNGAGKSTTFNMLTAKLVRTQGEVLLNNQQISKDFNFSNEFGICPQRDCLWDLLTPQEHLTIFGSIKGMEGSELQDAVTMYMQYLDIIQNKDALSKNLSGGNKRRLCVGISMIGAPKLGFFDEPSTGLDPLAKRYLKNLLQVSNKINQSSFVFTTHSMDEAESLCHRIGILVNGQFKCIDSVQNLKNSYGKIIIKLFLRSYQQNQINTVLHNAQIYLKQYQQNFEDQQCIQLEMPFTYTKYSQIYLFLNQIQALLLDYQITQSTLEHLFQQFAKQQQQIEIDIQN